MIAEIILGILCSVVLLTSAQVSIKSLESHPEQDVHYLHLTRDGKDHHFHLRRPLPAESVLSDDFAVIDAYTDRTGEQKFEFWTPDDESKAAANDLYIDGDNHATFRFKKLHDGSFAVTGLANQFSLHHDGISHYAKDYAAPRSMNDSILPPFDPPPPSIPVPMTRQKPQYTVELLLLCDKDLSDYFKQDKKKILDYFTTVLFDNNRRYSTLTSVSVSFRLSAIVLNANTASQPYIENSKVDGKVDFGKVLENTGKWLFENKGRLAAFDMASVAIKAATTWGGGLAWIGNVCDVGNNQNYNLFTYGEDGTWASPVIFTHESAHNLGAPHDDDEDKKEICNNAKGYIMSGGSPDLQYYFSNCSNTFITNNLKNKACLTQISNTKPEKTDFSNPLAPAMDELCQRRWDPKAYVDKADKANCKVVKCRLNGSGVYYMLDLTYLVDNMICEVNGQQGRCSRGSCVAPGK